MGLAETLAAPKRLEQAAATVAAGGLPDPALLVGLDLAAVDARVVELVEVARLQTAARDVLKLRDRANRLSETYAREREGARLKSISTGGKVLVTWPDAIPMRRASAEARAADEALAALVRLLPEDVAAVFADAQRALDSGRSEVERLAQRSDTVPQRRRALEHARSALDYRSGDYRTRRADLDAQLAELPSDAAIAKALQAARAALPALEAARDSALAACLEWTP